MDKREEIYLKVNKDSFFFFFFFLMTNRDSKFRYIIYGRPKGGRYTIEEAEWSDQEQKFIYEQIHLLSGFLLKQWLGYIPNTTGEIQTIIWMTFPHTTYHTKSPIQLWMKNRHIFFPYSLNRLRIRG
jgi:hypothetical protein